MFTTYFVNLYLTKWNDNWKTSKLTSSAQGYMKPTWIDLNNTVSQDLIITCDQLDSREFPKGCKDKKMPMDYGLNLYKGANWPTWVAWGYCRPYLGTGILEYKNMKPGKYTLNLMNYA